MFGELAQHQDDVPLGAESPSSNVLIINLVMRWSGITLVFYFVLKYYVCLQHLQASKLSIVPSAILMRYSEYFVFLFVSDILVLYPLEMEYLRMVPPANTDAICWLFGVYICLESYILKADVLDVRTPQKIQIFRRQIVWERENYQSQTLKANNSAMC